MVYEGGSYKSDINCVIRVELCTPNPREETSKITRHLISFRRIIATGARNQEKFTGSARVEWKYLFSLYGEEIPGLKVFSFNNNWLGRVQEGRGVPCQSNGGVSFNQFTYSISRDQEPTPL